MRSCFGENIILCCDLAFVAQRTVKAVISSKFSPESQGCYNEKGHSMQGRRLMGKALAMQVYGTQVQTVTTHDRRLWSQRSGGRDLGDLWEVD